MDHNTTYVLILLAVILGAAVLSLGFEILDNRKIREDLDDTRKQINKRK